MNSIGVHPMALIHPDRVTSDADRQKIARLTAQYASPGDYFVQRLSEGVGAIAAAFYPKPVVVRMSDFKTNEYRSLIGGEAFEDYRAKSDDRLSRRVALRPSELSRRLCA